MFMPPRRLIFPLLALLALVAIVALVLALAGRSDPLMAPTAARLAGAELFVDDLRQPMVLPDYPHAHITLEPDASVSLDTPKAMTRDLPTRWSVREGQLHLGEYPMTPVEARVPALGGGPDRGWTVGHFAEYPAYMGDPMPAWFERLRQWLRGQLANRGS